MKKDAVLIDAGDQSRLAESQSLELEVQKQAEFLAAATSENTRIAYRSAVRNFLAWGGHLPADEAEIIRYLVQHAEILNPRTLSLRLTALSQWHRFQGFSDPCSAPEIRKILTGISRIHARPRKKALALDMDGLERIVTALSGIDKLKAKRDCALIQIGYFGGFRRSELVSLQTEWIRWEVQGLMISLPRSKTDQLGQGIVKAIPYGDELCCPAKALKAWMLAAKITSGPIFRRIDQWGHMGDAAMHPASVNKVLTEAATLANLAYVPELSSHSLRRGMATSAYRAGASFRDIKRQGGWRFDGTVQGYIEEADHFEENATSVLLKNKKR